MLDMNLYGTRPLGYLRSHFYKLGRSLRCDGHKNLPSSDPFETICSPSSNSAECRLLPGDVTAKS